MTAVKRCPRCGLVKAAEAFYRRRHGRRLSSYCQLCTRAASHEGRRRRRQDPATAVQLRVVDRPATVETALGELAASGVAAPDGAGPARRWSPLAPSGDPLLDAVDLRGAHDFRHTFATWLEDAGLPARVIDELMGHEASTRGVQHLGSTMGAHYRHTTPEMATRVVMAIQDRLVVVVSVAEQVVEAQPTRVPRNVF